MYMYVLMYMDVCCMHSARTGYIYECVCTGYIYERIPHAHAHACIHARIHSYLVAGGKGMRRSEEARVSEEAVKRKGGGGGPRELGMSQG